MTQWLKSKRGKPITCSLDTALTKLTSRLVNLQHLAIFHMAKSRRLIKLFIPRLHKPTVVCLARKFKPTAKPKMPPPCSSTDNKSCSLRVTTNSLQSSTTIHSTSSLDSEHIKQHKVITYTYEAYLP